MDLNATPLGSFFVEYFALICISIVMYVIAVQRFKQHKRISTYTIILISSALLLAIAQTLEEFSKENGYLYPSIICAILGYTLRPACIFFMIMMSGRPLPKKYIWITVLPLIINFLVYCIALIPNAKGVVFNMTLGDDGKVHWSSGTFHYLTHVLSIGYLLFLFYVAFANLKSKHLNHSLIILVCSLFVVTAVVIETFFNDNNTIHILNVTIAVSTLFYYLYLYMETSQIDALTGLFNRETYYRDILKMEDTSSGVIQLDMDGLKYVNDNFGHLEGDRALSTIAEIITHSIKRNMYAYRLGGDEFLVIANGYSEEEIQNVVEKFKESLAKTNYHCSIGSAYRKDKSVSLEDLLKQAEIAMYIDKEEFYKNAKFERRKTDK